jgi:hypothetical protein
MSGPDRATQIRQAMSRRGWRVRARPTALGYLAQARRADARPDGPVPYGAGRTEVEALEELDAALGPFHRAR